MPARTVVFSQLDKPNDGDLPGHRPLRPDEFWQMAGRAGRRGMDELGYVIYAPTLSVGGLRTMASPHELREMLTGRMPAARSQLVVDHSFVLRHLARGCGEEVLTRTLRADGNRRERDALSAELAAADAAAGGAGAGGGGAALAAASARFAEVKAKLGGEEIGGVKMQIGQKARKALEKELRELKEAHGDAIEAQANADANRARLEQDIRANEEALRNEWARAYGWLCDYEFIAPATGPGPSLTLTARGQACAAFAEGHPLIIGTIISDGWLAGLNAREVCAWLGCFLRESSRMPELPDAPPSSGGEPPAAPSKALLQVLDESDHLAGMLDVKLSRNLCLLLLDWTRFKDVGRIASWLDGHELGSFVKGVMRIVSYVDVVRTVLLGLGEYETHNRLDAHMELLLGGLVTNESLYLHLVDA